VLLFSLEAGGTLVLVEDVGYKLPALCLLHLFRKMAAAPPVSL